MSWQPEYTISHRLLSTIREIGESIGEIKTLRLSNQTIARLELDARELSTYSSTSIEGNPLPLTDVKRLLKNHKDAIRDTEREVLNYNRALQSLYASVRSGKFTLNVKTLQRVQQQVVDGLMDNPAHCGKLRNEPVVIRNPRKVDEVIFLPPDVKDVSSLITDLLAFAKASTGKIDPIILAGLFHRQCVIIHPFIDGNGRTTRLLTTAILGQGGLDLFEIFSFENYYNRNISRYFKAVGLTGDYYDLADNMGFTEWLEYFADGILDELRRIRKTLAAYSAADATPVNSPPDNKTKEAKPEYKVTKPRLEPHHRSILNCIREHGSITQREYGAISTRSLASRKLDFDRLLKLDLIQAKGTGRGTYYVGGAGMVDE